MKQIKTYRTFNCGELNSKFINEIVTLSGWIDRRRDHGKLIFIDLRDSSGVVQLTLSEDNSERLKVESVIQITGAVVSRPIESINYDIPTGQIEIEVIDLVVLNDVKHVLPFSVSRNERTTVNEELRLQNRFLDLRSRRMSDNIRIRHKVTKTICDFLDSENFIDVETPILNRSTPEGAREYLVPSRIYKGEWFSLSQSPQLFKQMLMVGGIERYYQIARCFRDESLRVDRQPEFTQIDLEMSFMTQEEILSISERLISSIWRETKGVKLNTPFSRMSWSDAMERYGTDRPDTRYGLELLNVSDIFTDCGFKVFSNIIKQGGVVKCISINSDNEAITKSRLKVGGDLNDLAINLGSSGLAYIKINDKNEFDCINAIKDNLTEFQKEQIIAKTKANANSLIILCAGTTDVVNKTLGKLRQVLAEELNLIENTDSFLWVVDFPMFEYNKEEGKFCSLHHPFCMPNLEDLGENSEFWSEKIVHSRAQSYDLVLNGYELGGGSLRIHDSELQKMVLRILGLSEEEIEEQFGFLLKALDSGAPPHGGLAFGLDRILMLLLGEESIRDVIAFPKSSQTRCLLTNAPSIVNESQLLEFKE
jgi:aspartyl-tRNA synthetase